MSRQARIEEIEDSDPEEVDISQLEAPELQIAGSSFRPAKPPTTTTTTGRSSSSSSTARNINPSLLSDPEIIPAAAQTQTQFLSPDDSHTYKHYQCLYPIYFDAARSRAGGRKVGRSHAVHNPLAREIADACGQMGVKSVFEPGKTHPRDWANPGRVKVLLKQDGKAVHPMITNKFLLYQAIGKYLKDNPTTPETPLNLRIPNVPLDGKPAKPPIVPRGWTMGTILPLHSPALPGPGVSDDIFKEMMEGMGMGGMMGGPGGGAPGPSGGAIGGGGGAEKKEKKDKKKKR